MAIMPHPTARAAPAARYAPSPTGPLHLGNLRTALVARAEATALGATFILRMEDLDTPRTAPGAEAGILADLRWLGVAFDEGPDEGGPAGPYRQSQRLPLYDAALERLATAGLVYPCRCSRAILQRAAIAATAAGPSRAVPTEASAPHGPDFGPPYPGTCRPPRPVPCPWPPPPDTALRFRTDLDPVVEFHDAEASLQRFNLGALGGDFVVKRRDGLHAYQLACAVDDGLMGITHVTRGADLLPSTPRQIALLRALGLPEPVYRHIALVAGPDGARMAKRAGAPATLATLRAAGLNAQACVDAIMALPTVAG